MMVKQLFQSNMIIKKILIKVNKIIIGILMSFTGLSCLANGELLDRV